MEYKSIIDQSILKGITTTNNRRNIEDICKKGEQKFLFGESQDGLFEQIIEEIINNLKGEKKGLLNNKDVYKILKEFEGFYSNGLSGNGINFYFYGKINPEIVEKDEKQIFLLKLTEKFLKEFTKRNIKKNDPNGYYVYINLGEYGKDIIEELKNEIANNVRNKKSKSDKKYIELLLSTIENGSLEDRGFKIFINKQLIDFVLSGEGFQYEKKARTIKILDKEFILSQIKQEGALNLNGKKYIYVSNRKKDIIISGDDVFYMLNNNIGFIQEITKENLNFLEEFINELVSGGYIIGSSLDNYGNGLIFLINKNQEVYLFNPLVLI